MKVVIKASTNTLLHAQLTQLKSEDLFQTSSQHGSVSSLLLRQLIPINQPTDVLNKK